MLLLPETDVPEGTERNIQIMVPEGPVFHFAIDHPTTLEAGPNRDYKVPLVPSGQTIEFRIQAQQAIYGMTEEGLGEASIIIEYTEGE